MWNLRSLWEHVVVFQMKMVLENQSDYWPPMVQVVATVSIMVIVSYIVISDFVWTEWEVWHTLSSVSDCHITFPPALWLRSFLSQRGDFVHKLLSIPSRSRKGTQFFVVSLSCLESGFTKWTRLWTIGFGYVGCSHLESKQCYTLSFLLCQDED